MGETGFIYAVICAVTQGMQMIVMGVCLEKLLTGRDDRISQKNRLIVYTAFGFLFAGVKCLVPLPSIYIAIGSQSINSLFFIFVLVYFYSDRGRTKFMHVSMLLIQNVLADILDGLIWHRPNFELWENPFQYRVMAEVSMMVTAISFMLNILYTVIVLRVRSRKRTKTSPVWLALMLLLIFGFTGMRFIQEQDSQESIGWYFIYRCVFCVLEFATLMLYLSQSEKQEAQEEKRAAQEEIGKLHQVMELEKVHYEQIEARREEMAKIRHDYNNVITSVLFLIENDKADEAENVIKDLSERISKTREYPFCQVPIINAILTEKQRECEAEDIALTVDLLIPGKIGVADLDLCMVFGNLMDNAIRSCREVQAEGKAGNITLTAGMAQEYLIIKCRNTSLENREKKIKGSGYGHKILSDIAGKYDGDFQMDYENGIFTAQISLKKDAGKQRVLQR